MAITPAILRRLPHLIAIGATGFITATLLREYKNGGIKAHHFLQRSDVPALSNAWGLILLPLIGWVTGYFLQKRLTASPADAQKRILVKAIAAFSMMLATGFLISSLFLQDRVDILQWLPLVLLLAAVFLPLYRGEYLMGLVMGMTLTFGPVIPTVFGAVFCMISAVVHIILLPRLRIILRRRK